MKRTMLICGPLSSRSGYGNHARDIFYSFDKMDKFDIKVLDVRWGECPRDALKDESPTNQKIKNAIMHPNQINEWLAQSGQPDFYVDVRIPNEFQTIGKFNIGITAGVETSGVSQKWLEGCN